ncbi:hypothetical protein F2Q69_00034554 [Brassica cretica]|uniref:Uncharacterized protein n=1 Tax=Brassica cretica TaxID=69181 RepID=A0A8S9SJ24_BRACR|nr:hypothetical protein F2Q69_00034554 [Brassica cretica]
MGVYQQEDRPDCDGLVREVVSLVQTQVQDEVSQLQTEGDDSTASTNLSRFRIDEIVESSVPKKKGRLVGLGRLTRSVPPSSAPPPFVDPEVLTAQLKNKDDRISLLETQMAAQQAGYVAQRRLNQQMMERMQRMDTFLGIFRGIRSLEFSGGHVPWKFSMNILRNISSELPRIGPSESPSKYPEEVLPRKEIRHKIPLSETERLDNIGACHAFLVSISWVSVPKKKGRLVGLGRRTRSVPPSSAPPPFVDPEVLTAQLKDKDDRISLLETQMAAQQAGYEAQRRLNQQMMEMMQRMYPKEVFPNVPDP